MSTGLTSLAVIFAFLYLFTNFILFGIIAAVLAFVGLFLLFTE